MPGSSSFDARLRETTLLTPRVRELVFERVDAMPMAFEPGQFVTTRLSSSAATLKRSYSLASAPDGTPRFALAVTHVEGGPGSTWLHRIEPDTVVPFTGPFGAFTRRALDEHPSLFIATGTGVAPIRSMVRAALPSTCRQPLWVLLGVRNEADILYRSEFEEASASNPRVRFDVTLSRPASDWTGRRGYVQAHARSLFDELVSSASAEPHVYVCGLWKMVESVRDLFRIELGVPRGRVHSERYD